MFPLGIPPMNPALPQVEEKDDEEEEIDDTQSLPGLRAMLNTITNFFYQKHNEKFMS